MIKSAHFAVKYKKFIFETAILGLTHILGLVFIFPHLKEVKIVIANK